MFVLNDALMMYQALITRNLTIANIVKKYMKVKGDMLVMENISRKKNKKDFEELEKFLNGH